MCGIAGMISFKKPITRDGLQVMSDALARRGPDHEGMWEGDRAGLVHRRLSIVDLSEGASQPLWDVTGRYAIVFNGEIYNYQELRDELVAAGVVFRTVSDTEVLLRFFIREGMACLDRLRGMYAFAVWDTHERELFFARDRIGKKPFFYRHVHGESFWFASELKAITHALSTRPAIDGSAIRLFLGLQYVPAPLTGFEGIASLAPGQWGKLASDGTLTIHSYHAWKRDPLFTGTMQEAADETRRLVEQAVARRLVADVPLGAFLSGGIDSTAVATIMARQSATPIQTFTMGFPSFGADERAEAALTAKRIGSRHYAFEVRPEASRELVDVLVDLYDAPYADSSCLPTYLLAQQTRLYVKAVLTGDGGDEVFGGYRRYRYFSKLERMHALDRLRIAPASMHTLGIWLRDPRWTRGAAALKEMHASYAQGYGALFTGAYFSTPESVAYVASRYRESLGLLGALEFDLQSYLPDDLNVKMDRATMAWGLEARSPFLDQDLVAFACTLPQEMLFDARSGKKVLREALRGLVPDDVFARPKRGFQVPLAEWFRGSWRELFIERCLGDASKLGQYMPKNEVKGLLNANDRGIDHGNRLWMLLVLATWLERHS